MFLERERRKQCKGTKSKGNGLLSQSDFQYKYLACPSVVLRLGFNLKLEAVHNRKQILRHFTVGSPSPTMRAITLGQEGWAE